MSNDDWDKETSKIKRIKNNKIGFIRYPKTIEISSNRKKDNIDDQLSNILPSLDCSSKKYIPKNFLPEAKLDLHGFYAKEARIALIDFIEKSFNNSIRKLLIITGKGNPNDSTGIIKKNFPLWINEPTIRNRISAFYQAPDKYGGNGAFLVYLKKIC